MTLETTETFEMTTEVTSVYVNRFLEFFFRHYLLPNRLYFENINRIAIEGHEVLTFTFIDPQGRGYVDVELWARKPILVRMRPSDRALLRWALHQLREDVIMELQLFEEGVRRRTIHFSWVEGERIPLEKAISAHKRGVWKVFSGSMLPLFLIFLSLNFFIFATFGYYAPLMLVTIQLIIISFSDRVMARLGGWTIDQKNPIIHVLQCQLPTEDYEALRQKYSIDQLMKIKQDICKETLEIGEELNRQTALKVLSKHGIDCSLENLLIKKVNVYGLVREVADRFDLPVPKIVILNTMLPNASATGISPGHGTVLITTGLITQLEEGEVLSVLGHEFSHIKGRDPLILFALSASEYLFRAYILFPLILTLPSSVLLFQLIYSIYFPVVMGAIYFVGKFLEARADLESAIRIGQPKVLAWALRKIGFRRLRLERLQVYRVSAWLGWDPHPPTYFRIERLEKMEVPANEMHPMLRSIRDVINGFIEAVRSL